jgi:hypothetical protein
MAAKETRDPTISSGSTDTAQADGTHPARAASEVTHAAAKKEYRDNPDKPDRTTVAQLEVVKDTDAQAS